MTLLAMRSGCDRKRHFWSDYRALRDFARNNSPRSQIRATRKNKSAATQRNLRLGSEADVTAALMDVRFLADVSRGGGGLPLCAMFGRLLVGKGFLHVCSLGRCSHVFGLLARLADIIVARD